MNMQKFTQRSLEAIQSAQSLATELGNQQIEQIHLFAALLGQKDGLIPQLLSGMGITLPSIEAAVGTELQKLPRISGGGREMG